MKTLRQKFEAAVAAHQSGDIATATQTYRDVLAEQPDHADALHMLGVIAQQKGNSELALKLVEAALAKDPSMALAWCNRCLILRVLDRHDEALESARQAMEADADLADGYDMAGTILRSQRKFEEACRLLERAVALQPENIRFQSNYAALLLATNDLTGAWRAVRAGERLDPEFVPFTLANVLKAAGYPERAIPHFHKSFEMLPHYVDAAVNEAMSWLQIGAFERGWELWEKRADLDPYYKSVPLWDGGETGHLLVHEDQGLGDVIQCLRYLPQLKGKTKTITLQIAASLQKLAAAHFPDIEVRPHDAPVPDADARVRLMSLPYFFGTRLDTIPGGVPYLRAETEWRAEWQDRLAAMPHPRIGLVWGGNPANHNDRNRSLRFDQVAPLLQTTGAHFVSLQKGAQKEQADFAKYGLFDADPFMKDFTDTAGLIAELDLLISVDTAVAHLAAAMGKPAWLLIPFDGDWRWLIGREDSPWYPGLRIFRQTKPAQWDDVVERAAAEVRKLVAGDAGVLRPQIWRGPPLRQNPNAISLPE